MRIPKDTPAVNELLAKLDPEAVTRVFSRRISDDYRHWEELKHRMPPEGMTREEWWCALKIRREASLKAVSLLDRYGNPFVFSAPDRIARQLHEIDLGAGGRIGSLEPITNAETRDQYLIRSLMEEAGRSAISRNSGTDRGTALDLRYRRKQASFRQVRKHPPCKRVRSHCGFCRPDS